MASDISPENEQFIQHELESGAYRSREALLDEAVALLKRRRELQWEIQAGIDSGPSIPASEVFPRLEDKAKRLAQEGAR
jgi:Arc/MetJ-type ribon-helix-helix transcriptional regulator